MLLKALGIFFFILIFNLLVHKKLLVLYFQQHDSSKQRCNFAITAFPLGQCRAKKTQTLLTFSSVKKTSRRTGDRNLISPSHSALYSHSYLVGAHSPYMLMIYFGSCPVVKESRSCTLARVPLL